MVKLVDEKFCKPGEREIFLNEEKKKHPKAKVKHRNLKGEKEKIDLLTEPASVSLD